MRREVNVGNGERIARVIGGGSAMFWGLLLILSGPGPLFVWLAVATLIALGVDFVVTGLTGYCPLYHRLGRSTVRHGHG